MVKVDGCGHRRRATQKRVIVYEAIRRAGVCVLPSLRDTNV